MIFLASMVKKDRKFFVFLNWSLNLEVFSRKPMTRQLLTENTKIQLIYLQLFGALSVWQTIFLYSAWCLVCVSVPGSWRQPPLRTGPGRLWPSSFPAGSHRRWWSWCWGCSSPSCRSTRWAEATVSPGYKSEDKANLRKSCTESYTFSIQNSNTLSDYEFSFVFYMVVCIDWVTVLYLKTFCF